MCRPILIVVSVTLSSMFAGCGGDDLQRLAVSGSVSLDGQPLTSGTIRFQPLGNGHSAGGRIDAGRFEIPRSEGPGPGEFRIEIVSFQPTGRQVPDADLPGQMKAETRQVIPNQYNRQSALTATVEVAGANEFEFKLASE